MKKRKVRIVRPCPNCGSKKLTSYKTVFPKKLRKWHLECNKCHYCGKKAVFRFTAEIKWNKEKRNVKAN